MGYREEVPFDMLDGVVNIKTQLLEIGDDDVFGVLVLALIAESLPLYVAEVGGFMVFEFDDTDDLAVSQNSAVGFLGVGLVLLLGDEVEIGHRVERVAKDLDEEFSQKALLELLLFGRSDILLYGRIEEIGFVDFPRFVNQLCILCSEVFLDDTILKKHSKDKFDAAKVQQKNEIHKDFV